MHYVTLGTVGIESGFVGMNMENNLKVHSSVWKTMGDPEVLGSGLGWAPFS